MKLNWGTGITIFIIAFMVHILFLVYKTTQESSDLEAADYYEQEINYQKRIQAIQNLKDLDSDVEIKQKSKDILFLFPEEFEEENFKGEIYFFKPDNAKLDKKYAISSSERQQRIDKKDLSSGWYVVKVSGLNAGNTYFFEESIYIKN